MKFFPKIAVFCTALSVPSTAMAQEVAQPALPSAASTTGQMAQGAAFEWTADADGIEAATILAARLAQADLEGYALGPSQAVAINQAVARARTGTPADKAAADRIATDAFLSFVEFLTAPVPGILYGDDWARPARQSRGILLQNGKVVPSLAKFVSQNLETNAFYDQLRGTALAAQVTGEEREKVMASLARARAFPARSRFIVVDSATARLWMYENGRVVDHMKVVVGKKAYVTPEISSVIYYTTFNPYWHVPEHLVRGAVAPNAIRMGKSYLDSRGYEVIDRWDRNANVVDPSTVDWKAAQRTGDIKVRQRPGKDNSMGDMKFDFANPEGIYLHDTPKKEYFNEANRDLSNGCIRVEDAARLALWLRQGQPLPTTQTAEDHIVNAAPVPVYVTYLTANANDGELVFSKDIYDRDAPTLAALQARQQMGASSTAAGAGAGSN